MAQKNLVVPEGAKLAYSKVNSEYQALGLEIMKLKNFLSLGNSINIVSKEMYSTMETQLKEMIAYHGTLGNRILLFEKENPGIKEFIHCSKGAQVIGQFNPSGNTQVEEIKLRAAQLINCINAFGKDPRRVATAITDIEKAQMMAVKSLFS